MPRPSQVGGLFRSLAPLLLVLLSAAPGLAQGSILAGMGPVNRSMGGASTAAPLDATGTLYWNPAAIGGLPRSELDLGLELLYPRSTISSAIPAGAIGPGVPNRSIYGYTRDEAGVFPLPSGGLVFRPDGSKLTFGLGVFPSAGYGTNFPGSTTNPILTAPPPAGFGLGHVSSIYQVLQVAPTVSYQVFDRLFIGFAPILNMARLEFTPGVFFAPNDANGDGASNYPVATSTRFAFGGGFQAGLYYIASDAWKFGASFKSPQWFEPFRYQTADEKGQPQTVRYQVNSPLIVSLGTAYTGIDRLTIALDLRYINFHDTIGLKEAGFNPNGGVAGLGWVDAFAAALGAQYQLTDKLSMRMGYTYNTNPIPSQNTALNVASPLMYQHQLSMGASYNITENLVMSMAYSHLFYSTISGPYLTPTGAIPGAAASIGVASDSLVMGVSAKF